MVTFCTSTQAINKAGHPILPFATHNAEEFVEQAEAVINVNSRFNFVTDYASLTDAKKKILEEVSSNLAGIYLLSSSISGSVRVGMEDTINVLRDGALRGLGILRDKKAQDFVNAT